MRRPILILATMVVMLVVAGGVALAIDTYQCPAEAAPCKCPTGSVCRVILGTPAGDVIAGSNLESGDRISALAGDDSINGYAGGDYIDGGPDADYIVGGDGNDTLIGGDGDDGDVVGIYGGYGNDRIYGGPGYDECFGGPDHDTFASSCEAVPDREPGE